MSAIDDRKMFAPLRRGEAISPEAKLIAVLGAHQAGATAPTLADELLRSGAAIGMRAPVTRRVQELLDELKDAARVECIPDGRHRTVRTSRA